MVWDFASVLCDELGKCKQIFRWSWLCLAAPFAQLMATRQKNHESRARKGTTCERTICYNRDLRHEFNLNDRQLNTFVTSAQGFGFRQAGRWTVQHPRWSQVEHCFTCEAGPRTEMVEPALRTMRTARNVARSNISSSTWKYSCKLTYRSWQSPKLFYLQWSPKKNPWRCWLKPTWATWWSIWRHSRQRGFGNGFKYCRFLGEVLEVL